MRLTWWLMITAAACLDTTSPFLLQVLCCEVEGLLTQLLGDESIMDLLFSLLQQVEKCLAWSARSTAVLLSHGDAPKLVA